MKIKDIKSLHQKSAAELGKELTAKKLEIVKLKLERMTSPPKNRKYIDRLSDDIARIETVLKEMFIKEKIKA